MPSYERATDEVIDMAAAVLAKYENHKPILDAKVKVDYVFAVPGKDAEGNFVGNAITHHGCKAIGLTSKIGLKQRTKGLGDVEVLIDREWWNDASESSKRALLDHELTHIQPLTDEKNNFLRDDLGRPKIKIRAHDYEFGWFNVVAGRHGKHSLERKLAATMMETSGQIYWPDLVKEQLAA